MKLVQKRFLKETREFELGEEAVFVRIKGLLKEEKLTVSYSALDPEPVVTAAGIEFHGNARHGPQLALIQNNPDAETCDAFIAALKQKILKAGGVEAGRDQAPGWNVYEEPPEFDDEPDEDAFQPVNADRLTEDVAMLKTYLDEETIKPFIDSIERLIQEPGNEAVFEEMVAAFNGLGANQGAVLTYTTYLKVLLSKTIWS